MESNYVKLLTPNKITSVSFHTRSHASNVEGGECGVMTEGFIRFLEHINKIRRPNSMASRKSWVNICIFLTIVRCLYELCYRRLVEVLSIEKSFGAAQLTCFTRL